MKTVCTNCGEKNKKSSRFCAACGAELHNTKENSKKGNKGKYLLVTIVLLIICGGVACWILYDNGIIKIPFIAEKQSISYSSNEENKNNVTTNSHEWGLKIELSPEEILNNCQQYLVSIETINSDDQEEINGTGFLYKYNYDKSIVYVITSTSFANYRDDRHYVVTGDGQRYSSELLNRDEHSGIAILGFYCPDMRSAKMPTFCNEANLEQYESVYAISRMDTGKGIVSAGEIEGFDYSYSDLGIDQIVHSAAMSKSDEGSILVNKYGEIVGLYTSSPLIKNESSDIVLASESVCTLSDYIIHQGYVPNRGAIGINHKWEQLYGGSSFYIAKITSINIHSGLTSTDVKLGDYISKVDGEFVQNAFVNPDFLCKKPGDTVELKIIPSSKYNTLDIDNVYNVTIELMEGRQLYDPELDYYDSLMEDYNDYDDEEAIGYSYASNIPKLGITYSSVSNYQVYSTVVAIKGLPSGSLIITGISEDSALANTDAEVDDMIIAVNGKDMNTSDVLLDLIDKGAVGDSLTLTLCRLNSRTYQTSTFDITIKLVEDKGSSAETTTESDSIYDFGNEGSGSGAFRRDFDFGDFFKDYFGFGN